jgi:glucoamylase
MHKIILFLLSVIYITKINGINCPSNDFDKKDCGYLGIQKSECESKGCCWVESNNNNIPWCFYQDYTNSCYVPNSKLSEPFNSGELDKFYKYFLANININGKGGIAAAPDFHTPGGSYYYHWERDGALSMRTLIMTSSWNNIESIFKSYVNWIINTYSQTDPYGQDIRTEPKFELDNGSVYLGGWCRPQNDGPGLQAISLIMGADNLIKQNQTDWVKQFLWTGDKNKYNGGAIKYNLDYIVDGYKSVTCDLWEEITDPDFFWNKITMKMALYMGIEFSKNFGDYDSMNKYQNTFNLINSSLYQTHWNGEFILESNSRPQDSGVMVGLSVGYLESDNLFNPISLEVAKTIDSYNKLFCSEYSINIKDSNKNIPGILYGRYKGDIYAGGNPWVLLTASLASILYRGGNYIKLNGVPEDKILNQWEKTFNLNYTISNNKSSLADLFISQADGVMLRLRTHIIGNDYHLYEQLDKNTGYQISAVDLTWSYAEVLNAMYYREKYFNS